jgi:hypothetical protein
MLLSRWCPFIWKKKTIAVQQQNSSDLLGLLDNTFKPNSDAWEKYVLLTLNGYKMKSPEPNKNVKIHISH